MGDHYLKDYGNEPEFEDLVAAFFDNINRHGANIAFCNEEHDFFKEARKYTQDLDEIGQD
jgi:hypothetical protein